MKSDYSNPVIERYECDGQMDIYDYLGGKKMKCGFESWKDCTEKCIYYKTCARNPINQERYENAKKEKNKSNRIY